MTGPADAVQLARLFILGPFLLVAGWWLVVQAQRWYDGWRWNRTQRRGIR